jgi:hypothetical protein
MPLVLPPETLPAIRQACPAFDSIFLTGAKLFVAHPNPCAWTPREAGVLELARESNTSLAYINFYDFKDVRLVFQHELFQDFTKGFRVSEGTSFATIQSDSCVIGLSFTDPGDALKFRREVKTLLKGQTSGWFSRHFAPQAAPPDGRNSFKLRQRSASSRVMPRADLADEAAAQKQMARTQKQVPPTQKPEVPRPRFISDDLKQSEDFQKFLAASKIPAEDLNNPELTTTIVTSYLHWLTDPKRDDPPAPIGAASPVAASARLRRAVSTKILPAAPVEGSLRPEGEKRLSGELIGNMEYVEPRVEFPPGCNPMAVIAERLALRRRSLRGDEAKVTL